MHQETSNRSGHCVYSFYLYSSSEYEESINNNLAKEFTVAISIIFFVMGFSFCIYDKSVQRRNAKILAAAVRSNQIVSSIFPSHVTDKLLAEQDRKDTDTLNGLSQHMSRHARMKGDLLGLNSMCSTTREGDDDDDDNISVLFQTRPPIADLFTDTTIMFAGMLFLRCVRIQLFFSNSHRIFLQILLDSQLGYVTSIIFSWRCFQVIGNSQLTFVLILLQKEFISGTHSSIRLA